MLDPIAGVYYALFWIFVIENLYLALFWNSDSSKNEKSERVKIFKVVSKYYRGLTMMCRLIFYHI